jgi:hypothetical protein
MSAPGLRGRPWRRAARVSAPPPEAESITRAIDGGHVTPVRSYQARSCAVFVAQASNDNGTQVVFASMPAEAYRQTQQLRNVLHDLGATKTTSVIILSDGAGGPRALREAASVGPTQQVLDCFISPCAFTMSPRPPRTRPSRTWGSIGQSAG